MNVDFINSSTMWRWSCSSTTVPPLKKCNYCDVLKRYSRKKFANTKPWKVLWSALICFKLSFGYEKWQENVIDESNIWDTAEAGALSPRPERAPCDLRPGLSAVVDRHPALPIATKNLGLCELLWGGWKSWGKSGQMHGALGAISMSFWSLQTWTVLYGSLQYVVHVWVHCTTVQSISQHFNTQRKHVASPEVGGMTNVWCHQRGGFEWTILHFHLDFRRNLWNRLFISLVSPRSTSLPILCFSSGIDRDKKSHLAD